MSTPFASYPDWVRIGAVDVQPVDVSDVSKTYVGGVVVYGGFDCSNWQRLAGVLANNQAGEMVATFVWYADSTAVQPVAQRVVNIGAGAQASFSYQNMAPWVQVTVQSSAAGSLLLTAVMFRTNRLAPWPYFPLTPYLFLPFSYSIAASATQTITFAYVWSGPVGYRFSSGANSGLFQVQASTGSNSWQTIHQETVAASGNNDGVLDFPEASVRLQITNQVASLATFTAAMFPVATGAR